MKKKIILVVVFFILLPIIYIIVVLRSNNMYSNTIYNNIKNNTDIKDIVYINLENNFYVIKTKKKVFVLDNKFNIVSDYDINKIKYSNMDLVYKRNNLYYVKKNINDNSIIYKYFDIYNLKEKFEVVIGG